MKKALKPSLEITDGDLFILGNNVVGALLDNPYFQNPEPSIATAQAACNTYSGSLALSHTGSMQQRAQKDADKQILLSIMRELSDFVNDEAKGDLVKLATCGFPLSKDRKPVVLGMAEPKVMLCDASGEAMLSTPRVKGAFTYRHQYTKDPSVDVWPEVSSTKCKCKLKNLTPGQVYYFRILVIGTSDQVTVSAVIKRMVA
jgi:hypothetical protein